MALTLMEHLIAQSRRLRPLACSDHDRKHRGTRTGPRLQRLNSADPIMHRLLWEPTECEWKRGERAFDPRAMSVSTAPGATGRMSLRSRARPRGFPLAPPFRMRAPRESRWWGSVKMYGWRHRHARASGHNGPKATYDTIHPGRPPPLAKWKAATSALTLWAFSWKREARSAARFAGTRPPHPLRGYPAKIAKAAASPIR